MLRAHASDNMDGTYGARFQLLEVGVYEVVVTLEFSQCDGVCHPPVRRFRSETEHGERHNAVLGTVDDYTGKSKKCYVEKKSRKQVTFKEGMNSLRCTLVLGFTLRIS